MKSDVIIIGAGIIGCSIAHRLAKEGLKITVIEKNQPGREASWAAAGMLAPHVDTLHSISKVLLNLLEASHALYPNFVAELEEETGMTIGYQKNGSLVVATDYQETRILAGLYERLLNENKPVEELSKEQISSKQPGLSESVQSGLFFPNDHFVNNRELMQALVASSKKRGVEFLTETPVVGLEIEDRRVVGVKTENDVLKGNVIINAAGCWSGKIDNSLNVPVRPIRGQIVCLQIEPQPLQHLIHSTGCYIVPWPDGRTLIGSTLENVGYHKETTAEAISKLLSVALEVAPVLKEASVKNVWAGLRPDTSDNLPIIGGTSLENYFIATGHFRNGILLAPITAQLICELLISGETSISLKPFRVDRFQEN